MSRFGSALSNFAPLIVDMAEVYFSTLDRDDALRCLEWFVANCTWYAADCPKNDTRFSFDEAEVDSEWWVHKAALIACDHETKRPCRACYKRIRTAADNQRFSLAPDTPWPRTPSPSSRGRRIAAECFELELGRLVGGGDSGVDTNAGRQAFSSPEQAGAPPFVVDDGIGWRHVTEESERTRRGSSRLAENIPGKARC